MMHMAVSHSIEFQSCVWSLRLHKGGEEEEVNRKAWGSGKETDWNETFAGSQCVAQYAQSMNRKNIWSNKVLWCE